MTVAGDLYRLARFELVTKLRGNRLLLLCAVAVGLVALTVWRNVSYGAESLDHNLNPLRGLPALIEEMEVRIASGAATDDDRQQLAGLREQLASDRFDVYRSTVPGSVEVALGLGAGAGGVAIGLIVGAVVAGTEFRKGTAFYLLAFGPGRALMLVGKLVTVVPAAVGAVGVLAAAGAVIGSALNWIYRDNPGFGLYQADAGHLAAAAASTTAAIIVWGLIAVATTAALRSTFVTTVAMVTALAVDAMLTLRVGVRWLLTPRIAQLAGPLWPPESRFSTDTFGYLWWTSSGGERFELRPWSAVLVMAAVAAACATVAWWRVRRWDAPPAPDGEV